MSIQKIKSSLRTVPDFPKEGILFWDVTTLFKDAECLRELEDILYNIYKDKGITKVVGLESRGFVMGPALAIRLGAGFVMARKPGKLPAEVISESYEKEYGRDTIEIHKDAISEDDVVLIHDDLLATGGTVAAAARLVSQFHPKAVCINFIIEIEDLKGRALLPADAEVTSVLKV
ncbi:MAG: adenine phosphoribosyltransferase [Bacteroidales bacterium]|nr:adenine phosphoribosyltransferase [Bacteroidales bacterium]MBR4585654.1 adenine phosphoribosyltransferase [Bacteroidales bacterium]